MTYPFSLKTLLNKHRLTIVDVVLLSVLESGLFVAQFYFIGKGINDLINDSWNGIYILIAIFLARMVVGNLKQMRIGKTYKTIYDELVANAVALPMSQGLEMKTLAPKSTFIYVLTSFFKTDLIKGFETMVRLALVLIALFLLNKMIFGIALILVVVVFMLYFIRQKKSIQLSNHIAEELLKEHQILSSKDTDALFEHHAKMEKWDSQLLGISAINLSIIEILSFAFVIAAMVILVKTDGKNALGTFFTLLYYVTAFSETMFLLPTIYQKYLRMEEISKKI